MTGSWQIFSISRWPCTSDRARRQFNFISFYVRELQTKNKFSILLCQKATTTKRQQRLSLLHYIITFSRKSEKPQLKFPPRRYRGERLLTATPIDSDREASFPTRLALLETFQRTLTHINSRSDIFPCSESSRRRSDVPRINSLGDLDYQPFAVCLKSLGRTARQIFRQLSLRSPRNRLKTESNGMAKKDFFCLAFAQWRLDTTQRSRRAWDGYTLPLCWSRSSCGWCDSHFVYDSHVVVAVVPTLQFSSKAALYPRHQSWFLWMKTFCVGWFVDKTCWHRKSFALWHWFGDRFSVLLIELKLLITFFKCSTFSLH